MVKTKVYKYGLLPPIENADKIREEMLLAHRYRNILTEIERGRRAAIRSLLQSHGDMPALEAAVHEADARVETHVQALKTARAQARARVETQAMREAVTAARMARLEAMTALRAARQRIKDDATIAAERARIDERANELHKSARKYQAPFWGTYLLIESAMDDAKSAPLYDGVQPNDPRFLRLRRSFHDPATNLLCDSDVPGEGRIGVQLHGGLLLPEFLEGSDTRARMGSVGVSRRAGPNVQPSTRRSPEGLITFSQPTLSLRIGSDRRAPIWGTWPFVQGRPLPPDAKIKYVTVTLHQVGPDEVWTAEITFEADMTRSRPRPLSIDHESCVAIDIGWRALENGELRVAAWVDSEGKFGTLRLPVKMIAMLRQPESLRSVRDKMFNEAKKSLVSWIAEQGDRIPPDWILSKKDMQYLDAWRSVERLVRTVLRWKDRRLPGDEAIYEAMASWRYQDHHLWQWETRKRESAMRARKNFYRTFAAGLAERYDVVVLEDFDLRDMARLPEPESTEPSIRGARSNRSMAAVSELCLSISHAFAGDEARIPAYNTTRTCHLCGLVQAFDAARAIHHVCEGCHEVWDQDLNAGVNLRERWRVVRKTGVARTIREVAESLPKRESAWVRAKKNKAAKAAEKGGARKAGDESATG
jgi:hypothetical protein